MKSPLTISYNDLINLVHRKLSYAETEFPKLVQQGRKNEWAASHETACLKQLLKMLKKHQKNPQLNLNDLFNTLK